MVDHTYHIMIWHFLISTSFSFMLSLAYLYTWCLWSIIIWWHRRSRIKWNTLTTSSCHAYGMIPTSSDSLVAQYLADHRTNVLTYCLPSLTNMEEHNEVALESGMDPCEYDRRNYHGTPSSQSFPHLAHILPPRHFPLPKTVKQTKNPDLNISATNPAEPLPAKRI
jgi:hypothetical protein